MGRRLTLISAVWVLGAGCTGPAPRGPEGVVREYAKALRDQRVGDAFDRSTGVDRDTFNQRYRDDAARAQRAGQLEQAAVGDGTQVQLVLADGQWKVLERQPAAAPIEARAKETLKAFLNATERNDYELALSLLGKTWRGRYTAQRLKDDFTREPLARERLHRARVALDGTWLVAGETVELPLGDGKSVRLVKEGDELKVGALE